MNKKIFFFAACFLALVIGIAAQVASPLPGVYYNHVSGTTTGGGGAGSITNLSPYAASLYATAQSRIITNFATLFTNYSTSSSTNFTVDVSGTTATNGWMRTTNDGWFYLAFNINYRYNILTSVPRTNVFGVTTNVGSPGTNFTDVFLTDTGFGGTNHQNAGASGLIYCPSNTYIALGYYSIGTAVTNDLTINKLSLSAFLPGGSTFGSSGGLSALPSYAITNNQSSDWNSVGTVTVTNGGSATILSAGGISGNNANWTIGLLGSNPMNLDFDLANQAIYSSSPPFADLGRSAAPFNRVFGTNFFAKDSITTAANTTNKIAVFDAAGKLINSTGTADSTTFLRGDGTLAVPPGGSATPGGASSQIQFNQGGAFDGTNEFLFDRTNMTVGINLAGRRPRSTIANLELGGTAAGMIVGSGTATNWINYDGMRVFGASSQDLKLGNAAGQFWHLSGANGALHTPLGAASLDLGLAGVPVSFVHLQGQSNYVANLPGAASTVTMYGTNQSWKIDQSSNVTFAVSGLRSNVIYDVTWTNGASTVTWSTIDFWRDGAAPELTNGFYKVGVQKNHMGTTAWMIQDSQYALLADSNIVLTTNKVSKTITATLQAVVTNVANVKFAIQQPGITASNLVLNLNTNNIQCIGLTNVILTNWSGLVFGINGNVKVAIENTLGVSVPIVWPAKGAQHGLYKFHTNGQNDVLIATVAPPGTNTIASFEVDGTNIYGSVTYWPR